MNSSDFEREIRNILVRVNGLININDQGNQELLDRRLQGLRDKLNYLYAKAHRENRDVCQTVYEAIGDGNESDKE